MASVWNDTQVIVDGQSAGKVTARMGPDTGLTIVKVNHDRASLTFCGNAEDLVTFLMAAAARVLELHEAQVAS